MYQKISFNDAEIADRGDFTKISDNAQNAFDDLTGGALGWPAHWARFTVSLDTSPDSVKISEGEYYKDSKLFKQAEILTKSLETYKPLVATDERWVALVLRGSEDNENALRFVETAEQSIDQGSMLVEQALPKYSNRTIEVVVQTGEISPAPARRPTVNESDCAIAFVLLKTTGVEDIVAVESKRVKSIYEIHGRLVTVEASLEKLVADTETIKTDLAAVAAEQEKAPPPELMAQLMRDAARTSQALNLNDEIRDYYYDNGLLTDFWNLTDSRSRVRIDEGLRFPYQASRDHTVRLLNRNDENIIRFADDTILPDHHRIVRFEVKKGDQSQNISNTIHTIRTATQVTQSHTRIRYGASVSVCENGWGWENLQATKQQVIKALRGKDLKAGRMFEINGQNFVSQGLDHDRPGRGHDSVRLSKKIIDRYKTVYTKYDSKQVGLSGAIYYQTFPSSQLMIALGIQLYFNRVGSTGDVQLCLCEVNSSGTPDFDEIIKTTTVPQSDLKVGWVEFAFSPAVIEPGKQYAFFTVTTGNHELAKTSGNVFPEGTSGVSTDGVWAQGSIDHDLSFRLITARFKNNRYVVPMENITLAGGMSEIDMIYQGAQPGQSRVEVELKPEGIEGWGIPEPGDDNLLTSLPALCQMRFIFIGTPDIAPVLRLDSNTRLIASRLDSRMVAITKPVRFTIATSTIEVIVKIDNYDDHDHHHSVSIIANNRVIAASITQTVRDKLKPSKILVKASFPNISPPIRSVAAIVELTSSNQINFPFGEDIQINAR